VQIAARLEERAILDSTALVDTKGQPSRLYVDSNVTQLLQEDVMPE
jgi:hypothetical protein